jgi:hypothetical protein
MLGLPVLSFGLFDRPLRDALYLNDGTPLSGRRRASIDVDADDDRKTGFDEGPRLNPRPCPSTASGSPFVCPVEPRPPRRERG